MLREAPINGLLSPSVTQAKAGYGDTGMHTTTNPVAAHGNGVANGVGNKHATGNGSGIDTESTLGPHAINSGNTSTTV